MYQTEWGLPGTWINNKTGAISYEPKPTDTWTKRTFCLPFDAANVNSKWWNAYYISQADQGNAKFSYIDLDYTSKIEGCSIKCPKASEAFTKQDKVIYNIRGHAKKFGLFGWNIDVECFYAINDDFPNYDGGSTCTSSGCVNGKSGDGELDYTIRSVDLKKLFPSKDESQAERSPGFNWSKFATVSKELDPNYTSYPQEYSKWLQKINYNIYSSDDYYLDYYVKLTRETLGELREESSNNYTDFKGKASISEGSSVVNYRSPLFSSGGKLSGGENIYPNANALKCNNIGEKKSKTSGYEAECFVVEEESDE